MIECPEVTLVSTPVAPRLRVLPPHPEVAPAGITRRSGLLAVVVVITVVALVLRLQRLRFGLSHQIVDYDEGAYFGSALSFADGRLPYRDFVFVHPPLITVVLTPLALLAKLIGTAAALGLATVLTGIVGAASVPLTARLVWHRGPAVVVPAAALVALQGDAVASGYTLLLEPWLVLLCLLAAVIIFRGDHPTTGRRLVIGGVLLGLACATKIWAVVPVLAVLLVCLPDWRRVKLLLGGVLGGFLVPVLPFVILAPGRFVHEVFLVQIFRSPPVRTENTFRVLHLFSSAPPDGELPQAGVGWLLAAAAVIVIGGIVVTLRTVHRSNPLDRFAWLGAAFVAAMLFVPGTFYWHYAAFATPFLALSITLPLSWLGRHAARRWTAVLALAVVGLAVVAAHRSVTARGAIDEYAAFARAVPAGSCVLATMPSATVANDRYRTGPSCPQIVDPFGTALAYADGRQPSSNPPRGERITELWMQALRHADFLYVDRRETRTLPADPRMQQVLRTQFRLVVQPGLSGTLYERISSP